MSSIVRCSTAATAGARHDRRRSHLSALRPKSASLKAQLASASAQMRAAGLLAPLTDLPDEIEIEMLINLVTTKYEMLRAKPGEGDYAAQFKNSLHAISFQRKEPDGKLNKQRGLMFFPTLHRSGFGVSPTSGRRHRRACLCGRVDRSASAVFHARRRLGPHGSRLDGRRCDAAGLAVERDIDGRITGTGGTAIASDAAGTAASAVSAARRCSAVD